LEGVAAVSEVRRTVLDEPWERRDLLGVHKQKQEGLNWVGVSVPSGRLQAEDMEVCFV
jgi:sulfite reductase beta subunit-like hemoprotein